MEGSLPCGSRKLQTILDAQSVAIVGASADPGKLGSRPLALLRRHGYAGRIYPVNPGRDEIAGLKAYRSLSAIGEPIDLALLLTPAEGAPALVEEGIACGVRSFIIYAAGFAEQDERGLQLQRRIAELARQSGAAVLGPNCVGAMNVQTRLCATIASVGEVMDFVPGPFSFVSQSGAIGGYWLDKVLRAGMGFSKWVTSGNEADIGMDDCVTYLADDPSTRIIGLYLEAIRNPAGLRRALARAREQGKPVLALRSGRSAAGAQAVASHTAALAGDTQVCDAFLRQCGVQQVGSLTEMVDAAKLLLWGGGGEVRRPAIISVSGGVGALITDAVVQAGLSLHPFSAGVQARISQALPSFGKAANPMDLTGAVGADPTLLGSVLAPILQSGEHDFALVFIGLMHGTSQGLVQSLLQARAQAGCPLAVIWMSPPTGVADTLQREGIPVYDDIPAAVGALSLANRAVCAMAQPAGACPLAARPVRTPGQAVSEVMAHGLLGPVAGLRIPRETLVAAGQPGGTHGLSLPLAAKLQSPQLLHKTEHGAVVLGLCDQAAVDRAIGQLARIGQELGLPCDGVLLQEMVEHDVQMIVGLRQDEAFGPMLLVGRGGVDVEDERDTAILFLPVSAHEIEHALRGLRMARRLQGTRGRPPVDIPALAALLHTLCLLYEQREDIFEIEINPLAIAAPDRFTALDMLVRRSR